MPGTAERMTPFVSPTQEAMHQSDGTSAKELLSREQLISLSGFVPFRIAYDIIAIRDVPAYVCRQCGEAYVSAETSRMIDIVMDT